MTDTFLAPLPDRALAGISGDEATDFLQGLITNDINLLDGKSWLYTGLLTPQGKILFDFFIARQGAGFIIDCASDQMPDLLKRLKFYKLRADIDFTPLDSDHELAAIWGSNTGLALKGMDKHSFCLIDPRTKSAGKRAVIERGKTGDIVRQNNLTQTDLEAYHDHRIGLGLAESVDIGSAERFVHECDFDQLHGVSFTKGCYIGQEVVSRVEHRSNVRKRIVPVKLEDGSLEFGAEITAGSRAIGEVLSHTAAFGIAAIRLDFAGKAIKDGHALTIPHGTISMIVPEWARFEMPDAQDTD